MSWFFFRSGFEIRRSIVKILFPGSPGARSPNIQEVLPLYIFELLNFVKIFYIGILIHFLVIVGGETGSKNREFIF